MSMTIIYHLSGRYAYIEVYLLVLQKGKGLPKMIRSTSFSSRITVIQIQDFLEKLILQAFAVIVTVLFNFSKTLSYIHGYYVSVLT